MSGDGVIHIGRVDFRNDDRVFGIKQEDRFSHLYIIGKAGTGKSTLIETMALQDLERGNGFASTTFYLGTRRRSCCYYGGGVFRLAGGRNGGKFRIR
jgi:hypothetical protein